MISVLAFDLTVAPISVAINAASRVLTPKFHACSLFLTDFRMRGWPIACLNSTAAAASATERFRIGVRASSFVAGG
ncbi:hypothetical protein [Bradyrhizobium sp. BWC-3-1]|uniref:hypothetical protein n=1 Tax=Bradyrhizobium sp. BWC-3-1 TaxID=3080012 RepID=UPI00293E6D74|nr:hypothetical protein [Bradyrhizobium sp. BWC-3-1]WOH57710.1 hypothetical protein RX329_37100 [Bradyrhizobium sp. BWC-3-1]